MTVGLALSPVVVSHAYTCGWDAIDVVVLDAIRSGTADTVELPADVVKSLTHGYLAAGYVTRTQPGCDRYALTLSGRAYLNRLTADSATTRKAA
jgi:hypothetical protein